MKIVVVDYGLGNIFSVLAALSHLNYQVDVDIDGTKVGDSDCLIVPGVASFGAGISRLDDTGQSEQIREHYSSGKPLVGLCLGAQMFLNLSEESPGISGLGIVEGRCVGLNPELGRVPNQGWTYVEQTQHLIADENVWRNEYFYFSHSYKMVIDDNKAQLSTGNLGMETITATFQVDNVAGIQFHPERSGLRGLSFLNNQINTLSSIC